MGKKYIIELEEEPFCKIKERGGTNRELYCVKGFNSLVFDNNGLSKLQHYREEFHDNDLIGEIIACINAKRALKAVYEFIMKQEASETTDGVLEIFDKYIPRSER